MNGTRIQKRKKPGGRQATGRISHAWKEILLAHTPTYGSDVQVIAAHRQASPSIAVLATSLRLYRAVPRAVTCLASYRSKDSRIGQGCDAGIIVAESLAQNVLCMLAQQGRGDRVGDRRQIKAERRFDVGDRACGRVRNLADAMALAHFRRVESLLDSTQITDRDIG